MRNRRRNHVVAMFHRCHFTISRLVVVNKILLFVFAVFLSWPGFTPVMNLLYLVSRVFFLLAFCGKPSTIVVLSCCGSVYCLFVKCEVCADLLEFPRGVCGDRWQFTFFEVRIFRKLFFWVGVEFLRNFT